MRAVPKRPAAGTTLSGGVVPLALALGLVGLLSTQPIQAATEMAAGGQTGKKKAPVSSQNLNDDSKEKTMSTASRPPPPRVPPVEIDGIVYEQVLNARKLGMPDNCGYLSATDANSGQRLWVQQIYAVAFDYTDETDVQEAYFKRLERVDGKRQLLIENETGAKYLFDIDSRKVEALP